MNKYTVLAGKVEEKRPRRGGEDKLEVSLKETGREDVACIKVA
jgi:hypothetical protein